MIADYNTVPLMFDECNYKYFKHSLPRPKFEITNKIYVLASFLYNRDKKKKKHPIKWPIIQVTESYDFPDDVFRSMIVHEMIHYYIEWNGIKDNGDHGNVFKKMMNEYNEKYGLCITVTESPSSFKKTEKARKYSGLFGFVKSLFE